MEQLRLPFSTARRDADDELNDAQAARRLARMERERSRGLRSRDVRPRTVNPQRATKLETAVNRVLFPVEEFADVERPKTRADCIDGPRPCPWVGCRHNLYLDVLGNGSIRMNFPDIEPDSLEELPATCALDVAAEGGISMEETARRINLCREAVRQMEGRITQKLRATISADAELLEHAVGPRSGTRRRLPVTR